MNPDHRPDISASSPKSSSPSPASSSCSSTQPRPGRQLRRPSAGSPSAPWPPSGPALAAFPARRHGFYNTVQTDAFSVFFHVLICGIVLVALLLSLDALPANQHHRGEYFALMVFGAVGMCLMTSAVELLVVFIALEISSISTYILAGYRKHTGNQPRSRHQVLPARLLRHRLPPLRHRPHLRRHRLHPDQRNRAGSLPTPSHARSSSRLRPDLVGILFKVSAAPFHVWTPDVYEGAPSPVVALMSTAPKAAAFASSSASSTELPHALQPMWQPLIWIVAVLSMTVGNLAALRQENVKRMLAYSSIAHAGYLLAAFAGLGSHGIAAASFYIAAYAAMNVGIFAVVTRSAATTKAAPHRRLPRPLYRAPLLGSLLLFFLISLIGIPFTGGFFGKFYSFSTATVQGGAGLARPHRPAQLRPRPPPTTSAGRSLQRHIRKPLPMRRQHEQIHPTVVRHGVHHKPRTPDPRMIHNMPSPAILQRVLCTIEPSNQQEPAARLYKQNLLKSNQ
jgi:hypothetical protein